MRSDDEGQSLPVPAAAYGHSDEAPRQQEPAAERYKKMYDRASALARIGVWECDLATEELTWTDGVYDLFELPRGCALDRSEIVTFYDEDSRRQMERKRAAAIASGGSFSLDVKIRTAKGNARWIRLTADVETENGRSVRIFGTKQDITEAKAAQEKVQALQGELIHAGRASAMGAMASTLAHELNQPLAAIANYAASMRRVLTKPVVPPGAVENGLKAIEDCAFRASAIIRSLRALPSDAGWLRECLDPTAVIREAASIALSGASKGLVLKMQLGDGATILADPVQIQQVVINLVRNAVEAVEGEDRREIIVSTGVAGTAFELRVDDSGPGIPPDRLQSVFDALVSTKRSGMGLGLSISRTIVEAHGGRISAGNLPGGGASFRVTLPLA
ncbi:MAG TPA: ATP-binding protein [Allosphingosinicella sp.]|jgi:two-component system sensor kinase FixL